MKIKKVEIFKVGQSSSLDELEDILKHLPVNKNGIFKRRTKITIEYEK